MEHDNCGICMGSLSDGRPTTVLCSGINDDLEEWAHMFHTECIQAWINANIGRAISCPICRRDITPLNLENLPLESWIPIEIYLDAARIIIPGYIVKNFVVTIQQFFEYQRLEALDWAALGQFAAAHQRVENERASGQSPRLNTLVDSIGSHYRMNMTAAAVRHQGEEMLVSNGNIFALMVLLMFINIFKNRFYGRMGGGGGMVLRIGKESISVPSEFTNTIQEAFDSLKKGLSKTGGRSRKTRRRR